MSHIHPRLSRSYGCHYHLQRLWSECWTWHRYNGVSQELPGNVGRWVGSFHYPKCSQPKRLFSVPQGFSFAIVNVDYVTLVLFELFRALVLILFSVGSMTLTQALMDITMHLTTVRLFCPIEIVTWTLLLRHQSRANWRKVCASFWRCAAYALVYTCSGRNLNNQRSHRWYVHSCIWSNADF